MAQFTVTDYVASQLRDTAPLADWDASGVDRAHELATKLVALGVRDLAGLQLGATHVTSPGDNALIAPYDYYALVLMYGGKQFGWEGREPFLRGRQFAWSPEGHGNVSFDVVQTNGGFALIAGWNSSSDTSSIREFVIGALPVLAIAIPGLGFAIGNAIGTAVLGAETAAAYPALANAIGNAAIGTALNGGDLESAVKSAALGFAGGQVGGYAGSVALDATGVDLIAQATKSAVSAFIQGGDLKQAVAKSLITTGAQNVGDYFDSFSDDGSADAYDAFSQEALLPLPPPISYHDPVYDATNPPQGDTTVFDSNGVPANTTPIFNTGVIPAPQVAMNTSSLFPTPAINNPIPPAAQSAGTDYGNLIANVSHAALAAMQLVSAWNASKNPGLNTTARYVTSTGAVISASDNGLITTQTIDGRVTSARPPVGQPQATTSGSIVINNGNGTYTRIDAAGNRTTLPYTAGVGLSSLSTLMTPQNLMIAGGALLAIMMLR